PAGEGLRLVARAGQRRHRLVHGGGFHVVERRRNHAAASLACCSACHTRSGVQGIGTSWTPYGRSASTTALTTAGVDAIVPASPTPLTPSGLVVAGVSVRSVVNEGRSAALGTV